MLLLLTILAILNMKNSKNDSKKIDFAVVWDGIKSFARKSSAKPMLSSTAGLLNTLITRRLKGRWNKR